MLVELDIDFGPRTRDEDLVALQQLVRRFDGPTVVEVGSWLGRSALAMLGGGARQVHCIDTWRGTDDPADETNGHSPTAIFAAFCHNVGDELARRIWTYRGESAFWARIWKEPVDLVFIDADHRYDAVKSDIEAWTRHLKPGGILCGHDYSPAWPSVRRAVEETGPFQHVGLSIWWRQL